MKFSIFLLISVILFSDFAESVVIDCNYENQYNERTRYTCVVKNDLITSKDDREVTEVQGQHLSAYFFDNQDVEKFKSEGKQIFYFPRGITKFFKYIDWVIISKGGLKELSKHDLKQFGRYLKYLWLPYNSIKVIESDLFEYNPELRNLELRNNKIRHIESGAFDNLSKYLKLEFLDNPCSNKFDTKEKIEQNCKDSNYFKEISTFEFDDEDLTQNLTSTLKALESQQISNEKLTLEKTQLEAKVLELTEENEKLKMKVGNESQACESILSKFSSFESKFTKMDQKLSKIEGKLDQVPKKPRQG